MAKQNFGAVTSKCKICGINEWDSCGAKPAIWPCNVKECPYENPLSQNMTISEDQWSKIGSGLGQIEF